MQKTKHTSYEYILTELLKVYSAHAISSYGLVHIGMVSSYTYLQNSMTDEDVLLSDVDPLETLVAFTQLSTISERGNQSVTQFVHIVPSTSYYTHTDIA